MEKKSQERKVQFDEDKIVVLGPSFDFWLNEEDDIYDELYGETETGTSIPDGGKLSRPTRQEQGSPSDRGLQ